jgi:hypothetical protein
MAMTSGASAINATGTRSAKRLNGGDFDKNWLISCDVVARTRV